MRIIHATDYDDMSKRAASYILERFKDIHTIGLATGGTPKGLYEQLIPFLQKQDLTNMHTVNLDEYVGLAPEHPNSYRQVMNKLLFNEVDIPLANTHLPNGVASDLEEECKRYEALIHFLGVDLQILGIGENGHIGFNEPGVDKNSKTHIVKLTEETREANSRYFKQREDVPTHAITMGIQTILASKEIVLLASGEHKAQAIYDMVHLEPNPTCPASFLKHHKNVTIIVDTKASVKLTG
ncbi:glucosamine-6-phosphate deaminase [Paenalkalicoccus suaedae]|uniref:Glucosamine-6-phosphate deaminase n=1 Tax=Paenalkalicoccus suaedae TaxID=2592382 RepID=A0A859FAA9_9BACI|nr:glucosamine-6-phosphate deaminase [Paenalkalicoccus suaedae]QKS70159.1 glucosamine-6-phosphate deaminase [Paenalkalicoccus suaedae]